MAEIIVKAAADEVKIVGFEHLHLHTDYSLLDGYGTVEEYAERAPKIGQRFLCISDHGMMGAIPRQIKACEEHKLTPIFGCELYLNPNQPDCKGKKTGDIIKDWDEEAKKKMGKSYHLTVIAYNETGYRNLVRLSSWGWANGFYYKPRINHDILMAHKEGLVVCTGCYNSEIGQAYDKEGEEAAEAMVVKYIQMFGDKLRLEVMVLDFHKQKPYDRFLVKMHLKYGVQLVVTNDCHYCNADDSHMQRLMLMTQTGKTIQELEEAKQKAELTGEMADLFELQDSNLWMKSESEINDKWASDYTDIIPHDLFLEAKANTVAVCEMAKGVKLDRSVKLPKFPDADEKLAEAVWQGFKQRALPKSSEYLDRIKEEYQLICQKEFSSYFLIQKMMVDEARRYCRDVMGSVFGTEAVGPGRGSAVGSLIAYCLGITDVNPLQHDLLFSRFLSPARGGKQMKLRFKSEPVAL